MALGFQAIERRLLDSLVKVSQGRKPRIELLSPEQAQQADVVMIDTQDGQAMAWARGRHWLRAKAVIWVDAQAVPAGHMAAKRPVQWPMLPLMLARALEHGHRATPFASQAARLPGELFDRGLQSAAPRAMATDGHGNRVLLVDDSAAVRAYLRRLLEARGIVVDDVASAEGALAAAAASPYACILMDVLMPGMDGYDACRRIKALRGVAATAPVVMLTSKSSPFDRIRGKMAGCDAYLTKPVEAAHLHEVLQRYLTPSTATGPPASTRHAALPRQLT